MWTRRFKALNGKGENSKIVEKIAIYDDYGNQLDCCVIHKDENGRKFYYPTNPHDENGLFTDRPKDAIECIQNGFGDEFEYPSMFDFFRIVRFIDRDFGEDVRNKTLEEWGDTTFVYGVKVVDLNSFFIGSYVLKDKVTNRFIKSTDEILTFETELEANSFIEEVLSETESYFNEYKEIAPTSDAVVDEKVKMFFSRMLAKTGGLEAIHFDIFLKMAGGKIHGKDFRLKVVQIPV